MPAVGTFVAAVVQAAALVAAARTGGRSGCSLAIITTACTVGLLLLLPPEPGVVHLRRRKWFLGGMYGSTLARILLQVASVSDWCVAMAYSRGTCHSGLGCTSQR
jgi:hypothetical protein